MDLLAAIDESISSMTDLSPSMYVLAKAERLSKDPDTLLDDLATVISRDSALSANIMRLSNSAFFSASRPTESVEEAVKSIGFKGILDIIAMHSMKTFKPRSLKYYNMSDLEFWTHSLSIAVLTECIADAISLKSGSEYTIGMLSTIGILVISDTLEREIYDASYDATIPLTDWEEQAIGCNHSYAGARILEEWGFLPEFINPIEYQFSPRGNDDGTGITWTLSLARYILTQAGSNFKDIDSTNDDRIIEFADHFGIDTSEINKAVEAAQIKFEELKQDFLNLN